LEVDAKSSLARSLSIIIWVSKIKPASFLFKETDLDEKLFWTL